MALPAGQPAFTSGRNESGISQTATRTPTTAWRCNAWVTLIVNDACVSSHDLEGLDG
jgi:hypothetical protein